MSSFGPITMASGRSVLSYSVKTGNLLLALSRPSLFVRNRQRRSHLCHILLFRAAKILQVCWRLDPM